jgi:hypothetical protein
VRNRLVVDAPFAGIVHHWVAVCLPLPSTLAVLDMVVALGANSFYRVGLALLQRWHTLVECSSEFLSLETVAAQAADPSALLSLSQSFR